MEWILKERVDRIITFVECFELLEMGDLIQPLVSENVLFSLQERKLMRWSYDLQTIVLLLTIPFHWSDKLGF